MRKYDDDDGRTIVDMSEVESFSPFRLRLGASKKRVREQASGTEEEQPEPYFADKSERRAFMGGAIRAAVLIALVYLVGIGIVIFLMTLIPY